MNIKKMIEGNEERLITGLALLGAAIVIVAIDAFFKNHFFTWLALGAITYFAFEESAKIVGVASKSLTFIAAVTWVVAGVYPHPEILIFGVLVIILGNMAYKSSVDFKILFPLFYPLAPMLFVLALPLNFGIGYLVWLVFIVGATDTAAYYVGKNMGTIQFSPVSPKKTWEGFYGGIAAGTIMGLIAAYFTASSFWSALLISALVSISSVFGDLFESYLKRSAGVKDSGDIFPGHGGMLDRADGYLFGAVAMVILLNVFN